MPGGEIKALVVDDEPDIVDIYSTVLGALPRISNVGRAYSSAQGLECLCAEEPPTLIVFDRHEFERKGVEIRDVIDGIRGRCALIIVGGDSPDGMVFPSRFTDGAMSMSGYLGKPFPLKDLRALAIRCLDFLEGGDVTDVAQVDVKTEVSDFFVDITGNGEELFSRFKEFYLGAVDRREINIEFLRKFVDPRNGDLLKRVATVKGGESVMKNLIHDLRNAVQSYDAVKLKRPDSPEINRSFASFVREQLGILTKCVRAEQFFEDVDLKTFFEDVHFEEFNGHNKVSVDVPDGCKVYVPVGWLSSVVRNFIMNFNRAMDEAWLDAPMVGQVSSVSFKSFWLDIGAAVDGDFAVLKIPDNAALIPDELFHSIFSSRVKRSDVGVISSGSGKGLLNMAETVHSLGGEVYLRQLIDGVLMQRDGYGVETVCPDGVSLPVGATKEFEIRLPIKKSSKI